MRVNSLALIFFCVPPCLAWLPGPGLVAPTHRIRQKPQWSPVTLYQSESSSLTEDTDEERSITEKEKLLRQRDDAQAVLDRLVSLKGVLELDDPLLSMENYQRQVRQIEEQVQQLEMEIVPPAGLTMEEFKAAMALFFQMPFSVRYAFCEALELENPGKAAADLKQLPNIVTLLYQQRIQLTPQRLQDALATVQARQVVSSIKMSLVGDADATTSNTQSTSNDDFPKTLQDLFGEAGKSEEEMKLENTVNNVLGRVTRKEGMEVTKSNLDRVMKALGKETFVVSSTEKIPGGYVIRGKNTKPSGAELIEAIDAKLPEDFPAQVSLMDDVTDPDLMGGDPVLVLLNKDFSTETSGLLTFLCSLTALSSAFAYCVGVYGSNEVVTAALSEANAVQDAGGISLFTDRVLDVFLPLMCLQVWHELGHFSVAKLNKMEMGLPILLPFWSLPFMGAKTDLIASPPNKSALFDFAIAGPLAGLLGSVGLLAGGLVLTATADASTLQYYPSLPISLVTTSTLGGSMVDYFLGGGVVGVDNRFITMQDPSTAIFMHPVAVAGYCGVLINALQLLPLGSTDGGRMSLAIFGRYGQTFVGALVWVSLLIATLTLERPDILIAAWVVNNFVQNDLEIPCRDETDELSIPRVLAAVSLWFVTVLAITPLSQ